MPVWRKGWREDQAYSYDALTCMYDCPIPYAPLTYKFTGKERDSESGLDLMGARYYGSSMGRLMTPDPEGLGSSTQDPQSWNMYAYARNNPLRFTDPTGLSYEYCVQDQNGHYNQCHTVSDEQQSKDAQVNQFKNGKIYDGDTQIATYRQIDVDLPGDPEANRQAAAGIVASFNEGMKQFGINAVLSVGTAGIGIAAEAINDARLARNAAAAAEDLARTRSAPVGRLGSPIEVNGVNGGTEINGRWYTGHALDRMQGRGLVPSVVEDTIATGVKSPGNTPGTSVFTSGQARVVVNNAGDVVSVNPR